MAWVTTLGPDIAQVDYRLREGAGCGKGIEVDAQVDYRMDDAAAPLQWIGEGLREFGIEPGTDLGEADKDAARLIMSGQDPNNKDQLVDPKMAVDPRAKLAAGPLVAAVNATAESRGVTGAELLADRPRVAARFQRLERGLARQEHHRAPVRDLAKVARAAGIVLDDVYDAEPLAVARDHAGDRVRIGNRGYDLTLDVAKSFSVLQALAPPELARQLQETYAEAVTDTVTAMESWAGYGQRGHQGDGRTADRVDGTGLLGWSMTHHTARPVGNHAPDPHLHAHVSIANMIKGVDGQWSAIGAGGRDVMRHGHAADALMKARLRALTAERFGVCWERSEATGAWEVVGIDQELRDLFSKRHGQLREALDEAGLDPAGVSAKQEKFLARQTAEGKQPHQSVTDLRMDWRMQAMGAGYDPTTLVEHAAPGAGRARQPEPVDAEAVAARIFDPRDGLTAHRKSFSRADALAAVADAVPGGLPDQAALEELTDAALDSQFVERLGRDAGGPHLSNADRYTTCDLVEAEVAILTAADDRRDADYATVDPETTENAIADFENTAGFQLSDEQRAVVTRLATSGHGIDAVIGAAGTGKTTIMQVLAEAHQAAGHRVAGASTAAVAAHHLQGETGIPSTTIAAWLQRIDRGPGLAGVDVLVVDEAGMVDDRQAALLMAAAEESGTQIVGIGDPKQLRSPGVGSTFGDVHGIVDGLELRDNRRQRHETHRAALADWRDGGRRAALDKLVEAGCIHTEDTIEDTHAAMIGDWDSRRHQWPDPHDAIAMHLMLASTNEDVNALNDACQAVRLDAGDLDVDAGYEYRAPDGRPMTLHPGDIVMTRINDRHQVSGPSVLNGYRGVVLDIDTDTGAATVQWRDKTPRGLILREQALGRDYIERGGATLGYALTVHKAQGQTAESVTGNLTGLEPTAAYPLLTRHRGDLNVWLTRDVLEDDETRARLGEPGDDAEKLRRALDAYATQLERPDPEELVIAELADRYEHLLAHREPASRNADQNASRTDSVESPTRRRAPDWWERLHGALTDGELQRRRDALAAEVAQQEQAQAAWQVRQDRRAEVRQRLLDDAEAGHGDTAQALEQRRDKLAAAIRAGDAAAGEHAAARAIQERITGIAAQQRDLQEQASRNVAWLRLRGTSRDHLRRQSTGLGVELSRLAGERDRHRDAASQHTAIADRAAREAGLRDHTAAPAALRDLHQNWGHHHAEAVAADLAAADQLALPHAAYPDPQPVDPLPARRELESLQAEAELRDDQHPKTVQRERRDRAVARTEVADQLARDDAEPRDPVDQREAAAIDAERAALEEQHRAETPERDRRRRPDPRPDEPRHRRHYPAPGIDRSGPGLSL